MDGLRHLIATGSYHPGDKIPAENELSVMFSVGRSTIREAVKIFQHLGVMEVQVPRGTFIRDRSRISSEVVTWTILLGERDWGELAELRRCVETSAADKLIDGLMRLSPRTKAHLSRLNKALADMEEAAESLMIDDAIAATEEFLDAIVEASDNRLYLAIHRAIRRPLPREQLRNTRDRNESLQKIVSHYRSMRDGIVSGDRARIHILFGKQDEADICRSMVNERSPIGNHRI